MQVLSFTCSKHYVVFYTKLDNSVTVCVSELNLFSLLNILCQNDINFVRYATCWSTAASCTGARSRAFSLKLPHHRVTTAMCSLVEILQIALLMLPSSLTTADERQTDGRLENLRFMDVCISGLCAPPHVCYLYYRRLVLVLLSRLWSCLLWDLRTRKYFQLEYLLAEVVTTVRWLRSSSFLQQWQDDDVRFSQFESWIENADVTYEPRAPHWLSYFVSCFFLLF